MSDESQKDDVLELTDDLAEAYATGPSAAVPNAVQPQGKPPVPSGDIASQGDANSSVADDSDDDDVLELGHHHIVEGEASDAVIVASTPPPKPPMAVRPTGNDIPLARISMYSGAAMSDKEASPLNEPTSRDDLFELQEGHVIEEGTQVPTNDNEPVGHAFDFGTPAMVFDETEAVDTLGGKIEQFAVSKAEAQQANALEEKSSSSADELRSVPPQALEAPSSTPDEFGGQQPQFAAVHNHEPQRSPSMEESENQANVDLVDEAVSASSADWPEIDSSQKYVSYLDEVSSAPTESRPDDSADDGSTVEMDEAVGVDKHVEPVNSDIMQDAASPASFADAAAQLGQGRDDESDVLDITDVEEVVAEEQKSPVRPPPAPAGRPMNSYFKNDKVDAANASLKLKARTARRSRGKKREWWASIFDDEYLMLLPERSSYEQQKQIDFIQRYMGLPPGALLLDLACGNGRNSIGMAQRDYRIVGVDLSLSMLARAGDAAQEAGQKINFIHGDMRDLGFDKTFDGVFSLDTSFGYFDEVTNMKVLQGIYRALKPGGTFLLELSNRDFVIKQQPNMVWFQMDNMVCMEETDFNYINNRLYLSRQLIIGDNEKQSKHEFSLRLYSLHEIGQLLHHAGFAVIKVSGHRATPGAFFGPESSKLIIIAERRGE